MTAANWLCRRKNRPVRGPEFRPRLEALEDRWVPDGLPSRFSEFSVPTQNSGPDAITAGPNNTVWFGETGASNVGVVDNLVTGHVTEHPTTDGQMGAGGRTGAIAYDKFTGNIWYAEASNGTPDISNISSVGEMAPDGDIVNDETFDGGSGVGALAPDGQGNIWYSQYGNPSLWRRNPDGTLPKFSPFAVGAQFGTANVAFDSQVPANLWFTDSLDNHIGRVDPDTGTIKFLGFYPGSVLRGLAFDADGNAWTCGIQNSSIVRFNIATGTDCVFQTPTLNSQPDSIVAEPGGTGAFWFAESGVNKIGRISSSGQIKEYSIPTAGSGLELLTVGPDGNLWFTERNSNQIGRFILPHGSPTVSFEFRDAQDNPVTTLREGQVFSVVPTSGFQGDQFHWSITKPDGTVISNPGSIVADTGTYAVTLTIIDFLGNSASTTQDITVRNLPPSVTLGLSLGSGNLDPAFGTGGVANTDGSGDSTSGLAQLPDGRLVSLFTASDGVHQGLRFFAADGSPDGRTVFSLPMSVTAFAVQGSQIVVVGQSNSAATMLARFDSDGSQDNGFGTPVVSTSIGGPIQMTVQGDNKIVVVGGTASGLVLIRRNADGSADMTNSVTTAYNSPAAVLVQPDGRIVVGDTNLAVLRFDADGNLDTGFGNFGVANQVSFFAFSPVNENVVFPTLSALALDPRPGGAIVVATGGGIIRLMSDGQLDAAFGPAHDGVVLFPWFAYSVNQSVASFNPALPQYVDAVLGDGSLIVNNFDVAPNPPSGVAVQPDGTILVGGLGSRPYGPDSQLSIDGTYGPVWGPGLVCLNADGSLNDTFGPSHNGIATTGAIALVTGMVATADRVTLAYGGISLARFMMPPASSTVLVGQEVNLAVSATDPGLADQAAGFAYQIDWGDGATSTISRSPGNSAVFPVHVYDQAGTYTVGVTATDNEGASSSVAPLSITVSSMTATNLQQQLSQGGPVTIDATTNDAANAVLAAVNTLTSQSFTVPVSLTINLSGAAKYGSETISVPDNVTLYINGDPQAQVPTTVDPAVSALVVNSGRAIVSHVTFTESGDAPTILVAGGHLTLRNDVIQESSGYSQAAIEVAGGTVDLGTTAAPGGNTVNINGTGTWVRNATPLAIPTVGDTFEVNGAPVVPSSLSGIVWEDFNDDGQVDFGERGIHGVNVTLTGTDYLGGPVSLSQTTDGDGAYVFPLLLPGTYKITETQPTGYLQGIDTVGTAGGSLAATDQFLVSLGPGVDGMNYNFGEQPASTGPVKKGQAAGIGFWNNKNGQALINAFNGGTGTELADWLAATMPNTFGVTAGSNNLIHKSNAYVANLFQQDFVLKGIKLDAQVLATALNVYATNATLDSTKAAAQYGFTVNDDGVGAAGVNVGVDGNAFGAANNATMTVMDLLKATDAQAADGVLYNGDTTKRKEANDIYSFINQAGGL